LIDLSREDLTKGFELYKFYLAVKQHFSNDSYDIVKYNGKVRANITTFQRRHDRYHFCRLAREKKSRDIVIANLSNDINTWIGDIVGSEEANRIYYDWAKKQESISYTFKSDLSELDEDFDSNIIVKNGQHPRLLKLTISKRINIETLIIIDDLIHCFEYWDNAIGETVIYPKFKKRALKYKAFIDYDKVKMRKILLDKFR